jgi:hypothetical protein
MRPTTEPLAGQLGLYTRKKVDVGFSCASEWTRRSGGKHALGRRPQRYLERTWLYDRYCLVEQNQAAFFEDGKLLRKVDIRIFLLYTLVP